MTKKVVHRIKTISEYHMVMGLEPPDHPLISVVDYEAVKLPCKAAMSLVFDFYSISLDRNFKGRMKYGQQEGDFNDGVLFFMSPGQLFEIIPDDGEIVNRSGWLLLIHPDFLWDSVQAKSMNDYEYFSYTVKEALFLSPGEEKAILQILKNIKQEYQANIDKFSQPLILAQIELLLIYADRFYNRQFITRKVINHTLLTKLEDLLNDYFKSTRLLTEGIPMVEHIASSMNVSPGYLSGLLKMLTGRTTQQYIHDKLIEHAKGKLATTDLSVSEIAYELGFEHPQSFSRLFKTKTKLSPLEFRAGFN